MLTPNLLIIRSIGQVSTRSNEYDFSMEYALSVLKGHPDNLQVQLTRGNHVFIATRNDWPTIRVSHMVPIDGEWILTEYAEYAK